MAEFHRVFFGADFTYKIDSFLSVQDCALAKIMAKNNNFRIAKFVFASQIFTLSTANDFLPPKIMIDLPCQESIDFRYFYFCQKNITFGVTLVSRMCVSFVWRGFHVIRFESALLSITNWAIPILFFVYFWSFQTSDTIFQRVNVKKCPSSLWGFEATTS